MDRSTVIYLVKETRTQDEIGQYISEETKRKVYCDVKSVSQTEFFEAGRNGIKPSLVIVMFSYDYQGELIVEHKGKRYGVYRTYIARNDNIELYCEEKGGIR